MVPVSARSINRARARRLARRRRRASGVAAATAVALGVGTPAASARTITVENLDDSGPGSLREAVELANADATADRITFAGGVRGEIVLTSGEIAIDAELTIAGPGAEELAVSGDADADGSGDAGDSRVFHVRPDATGSAGDAVTVSGIAITDGFAGTSAGGGILAEGADLTLAGVILSGNRAGSRGGGVYAEGSRLTIADSLLTGNAAAGSGGAAYADDDGSASFATGLSVRNSTFSGNAAGTNGGGLYVDNRVDEVLISHSALVDNDAGGDGGGLFLNGPDAGPAKVVDSTISGNAAIRGGGIYVRNEYDVEVSVDNSTVADNSAAASGGGVFRRGVDVPARPGGDAVGISSTIVADNEAPAGSDLGEPASASGGFVVGHSLIGTTDGATIDPSPHGSNQLNVGARLKPLADNGGPTPTMLPAASSPAVDGGVANGLSRDQRGRARTVDHGIARDGAASDGTDIGAAELADPRVSSVVVKARPEQRQRATRVIVKLKAGAGERVRVEAAGRVEAGGEFALTPARAVAAPAGRRTLALRLRRAASDRVLGALAAGEPGRARIEVVLTDAAGNEATKRLRVRLAPGGGR